MVVIIVIASRDGGARQADLTRNQDEFGHASWIRANSSSPGLQSCHVMVQKSEAAVPRCCDCDCDCDRDRMRY